MNAMEKKTIIAYFDGLAAGWDADMIRNESAITRILDMADIREGVSVLDVACGTGVLFPDYRKRNVAQITGVDISPEMIRMARQKFQDDSRIALYVEDIMEKEFPPIFDRCMVYKAFPHFSDPARLIERLANCLKPDGRLTVAHGMSREKIDAHHKGSAKCVSVGLMPAEELQALFAPYFTVDAVVSDASMYLVSGRK